MKADKVGRVGYNKFGTKMIIIEYHGWENIIVEFQDKYKAKVRTNNSNFTKGKVKNPYDKIVCNAGYIGEGKYNEKDYQNIYKHWYSMLKRCYDPYELNKQPTYIDCYVCEEWLCYQNFAKWYEENYYNISNETMCLDKDIICKGNKIYNPQTCVFVPQRINNLFVKRQNDRGKYPIGISFNIERNKYVVRCGMICDGKKKNKNLGYYNTLDDAFMTYKNFKENYIKQVANEYKDYIPVKLYEAMYRYEVEVTD